MITAILFTLTAHASSRGEYLEGIRERYFRKEKTVSYHELRFSHPVGRKEYSCAWCAEKILKGEKHFARAYLFYGEFNQDRMHLECLEAMNDKPKDELEDGWMPGDFERPKINNETKEQTCGEIQK